MPLVSKAFGDIITFTRASTATYFDATGTLQSAAIDAPRFDYDPDTLAARGFLIEEARTNGIRNNTMQGAVAPSTFPTNWQTVPVAGITATIVGTGTQNGITYLDVRVSGTPTFSSFYNLVPDILVAGASGQTWTGSFWASLVAGSLTNTTPNIEIRESDAAQGFLANTISAVSVTSTLTRYSQTRTLNNASTAFVSVRFVWQVTNGLPVDFTLRIGLPQLEQGAFATSVIPTTTTALTRSADVASVNTLSPWFNASESTLYAEVLLASIPPSGTFPTYVGLNSGTSAELISLSSNGFGNHRVSVRSGGAGLWDVNAGGSIVAGTPSKWALAVASGSQAACANGGSVATNSTAGLPTGINAMRIGAQSTVAAVVGAAWIRRVTYYPRKLSSAELQAITA